MDPAMAIEVAAMSRQRALDETIALGHSPVQEFYRDCTVLITGGSGFMGKQLIEKLLRSCEISKVFVLLRSKKGVEIQARLDEMIKDPVFETLRKQKPGFEEGIVAIAGDVAELRLGIRDEDWETITNKVDVIYHMAATTRFDEPIKVATLINVRGTREAITLAKACKKLKSYVHVSTAYTQARARAIDQHVYEQFYPAPIQPTVLISMVETMDEGVLNKLTDTLIEDWPNTYTFTKAVAEDLIRTETDGLPVAIVRPGIVIASYREPTPGWLDMSCAYGVSGLILGFGLGVIRIFRMRPLTEFGLIPCDFVNNVVLVAGKAVSCGGQNTNIYTVTSVARNTVTVGKMESIYNENFMKIMTPRAVYYMSRSGRGVTNKFLYIFLSWLLHFIPAYILDSLCLIMGKQRRFVKIYKKIDKIANALTFFSLNSFKFHDQNLELLHKKMSKSDQIIFDFDIPSIDWNEYMQIWAIGIRKYIIKDGLKGTNEAYKRQFWLKILHHCVSTVYFYCLYKVICVIFNSFCAIVSIFLN